MAIESQTDLDKHRLVHALRVAADTFDRHAATVHADARLRDEFMRYATDCRKIMEKIEDADRVVALWEA